MSSARLTKGEPAYRLDFVEVLKEVIRPHDFEVKNEIRITNNPRVREMNLSGYPTKPFRNGSAD